MSGSDSSLVEVTIYATRTIEYEHKVMLDEEAAVFLTQMEGEELINLFEDEISPTDAVWGSWDAMEAIFMSGNDDDSN